MPTSRLIRLSLYILAGACIGCAPPQPSTIPPAPIRFHWPDPAFEPTAQCHGAYAVADLERMLPRIELVLSVPATRQVQLDTKLRCVIVTVEDTETGRFAELLLRGVGVPRQAVLLQLAEPHG